MSQKIKVTEYTSASIKGESNKSSRKKIAKSTNSHARLDINFLKFSTAMVKANTTRSLDFPSQVYDIFLSALSLYGLLDYKQSKICLKNGFRDKYRDFSKSGRIGELAQAINYLFAQQQLGFKFVVDFDTFLEVNDIASKSAGGTPDYVLLGKPGKNLAVLESKGSSLKDELTMPQLRSKLQGAMDKQCLVGVKYLQNQGKMFVSNSYASVVEFAEASESRDSLIHFADPEYDDFTEYNYSLTVKDYYSRWFLFIGDSLVNPENNEEQLSKYFEVEIYEGMEFYLQTSSYNYGNLVIPIRYGVSKRVVELFRLGSYQTLYSLEIKEKSLENIEIFSDGTIAKSTKDI